MHDNVNDFKNRLLKLRNERGMNQKDFAKFLDTTPSTLSRYESGNMMPNLEQCITIAKKCNCTLDWLAGFGDINNIERRG
ncbi:helix-turn-helix domain-containing protein [Anaerosporobacter sp.]